MPLRILRGFSKNDKEPQTPDASPERRSVWRTGLLLVSSAAFGGIAVAIWNRRTLALMRQQSETSVDPSSPDER